MKNSKEDFKNTIYVALLVGISGIGVAFFGIMAIFFAIGSLGAVGLGLFWLALGKLIISGLFALVCWISIVICKYVWERKDLNVFR